MKYAAENGDDISFIVVDSAFSNLKKMAMDIAKVTINKSKLITCLKELNKFTKFCSSSWSFCYKYGY